MTSPSRTWSERLTASREQLRSLSVRAEEALTTPDPATGEQWTGGQVFAHICEFVPYWLGEAARMVSGDDATVAVGRTKKDPDRLSAVASAGATPLPDLVSDAFSHLAAAEQVLARLSTADLSAAGQHVTRGRMTAGELIEVFVIEHLEEHVAQLREALEDTER